MTHQHKEAFCLMWYGCSQFEDYTRTAKLHDWTYETQTFYLAAGAKEKTE